MNATCKMPNNEELYQAVEILHGYCKAQPSCNVCAFYIKENDSMNCEASFCRISECAPCDWSIHCPDLYRPLG